mmetsp:Transcript_13396/g.34269  ORF Transcript_13396/g.34269 Transcript_13396/m.34269 type:complete len:684 (+) Transcript_13396:83-2134(+)
MPVSPRKGTESDLAEERIKARRERIARRVKAAEAGVAHVETDEDVDWVDPTPHRSNLKIEEVAEIVDLGREDMTQKVSLVRATADLADSQRRQAEEEARDARRSRIAEDRAASHAAFAEIEAKWSSALERRGVEDLKEALDAQKAACDEVLRRKDALADDFRQALKEKDNQYVEEQRSQASDVQTILSTMSQQAKAVWKDYKKHLGDMEDTFLEERAELLETTKDKWAGYADQRRGDEETQANARLQGIADHEDRMDHLREKEGMEYNAVKAKLTNDIHQLEQQVELMRATYQLNSEKLDYNYQVLKKRSEENAITISQQKRKISRMQDQINNLRLRARKSEKDGHAENAALTEDFKRIADRFKELQKKFRHFQVADNTQYEEVFAMNEEVGTGLVKELLAVDKVLFEQQMGLKWVEPDKSIFSSLTDEALAAGRPATDVLADVVEVEDDGEGDGDGGGGAAAEVVVGDIPGHVVKRALYLLADEAEFLLEQRLLGLLAPLEEKQRYLLKLDSIFKALGVENEFSIYQLVGHLVVPPAEGAVPPLYELIAPNQVNAALKDFVDEHRKTQGLGENAEGGPADAGIPLLAKHRADYWSHLAHIHPDLHGRVWDAVHDGLHKYEEVLESRKGALERSEELALQNAELKQLLQQYMTSDVNKALVIPPTAVLTQNDTFRVGSSAAPS